MVVVWVFGKSDTVNMLQRSTERLIVCTIVGVDEKDATVGDRELRVEGAVEERRPHAQDDSVGVDFAIATSENNVGVFGVVVDAEIA